MGLISSYETRPLCRVGEVDLELLGDSDPTFLLCFLGAASGDRGVVESRLLDLEADLLVGEF